MAAPKEYRRYSARCLQEARTSEDYRLKGISCRNGPKLAVKSPSSVTPPKRRCISLIIRTNSEFWWG